MRKGSGVVLVYLRPAHQFTDDRHFFQLLPVHAHQCIPYLEMIEQERERERERTRGKEREREREREIY